MKAVILAGGKGSRMGSAGDTLPKPVMPIGDRPLIWHVMRFLADSSDEFLIALGHSRDKVREHLQAHAEKIKQRDDCLAELDFRDEDVSWRAKLFDTGQNTQTAGRLRRLSDYLRETFIFAWVDGLTDADLREMIAFHHQHGCLVTMLAVNPPARFGHLQINAQGAITRFSEKQVSRNEWINGGLCIVEPGVFELIQSDGDSWEYDVLPRLVEQGQLMAWPHEGFWQCIDYPHEVVELAVIYSQGQAPWIK